MYDFFFSSGAEGVKMENRAKRVKRFYSLEEAIIMVTEKEGSHIPLSETEKVGGNIGFSPASSRC